MAVAFETHYGHTAVRDVATCKTVWEAGHETWGPQTPLLISPPTANALPSTATPAARACTPPPTGAYSGWGSSATCSRSPPTRALRRDARRAHPRARRRRRSASSTIDRERSSSDAMYPTPDGKRAIIHGYFDTGYATTFAYDLTTGKRLWQIKGTDYRFFLLPDNQTFVSEYSTIRLRSLATGLDVAAFDPGRLSVGTHPRAPRRQDLALRHRRRPHPPLPRRLPRPLIVPQGLWAPPRARHRYRSPCFCSRLRSPLGVELDLNRLRAHHDFHRLERSSQKTSSLLYPA